MTDRSDYAVDARATASPEGSAAAIVLECDAGEWSLNTYDREGTLGAYLSDTSPDERAQILALGRAIVEALDPVPDRPTVDEPLAEWERDLLDTPWEGPTLTDEPESAREHLRRLVGEGVGAASTCWAGTPQGVFLDRRASSIVDAILAAVDGLDPVPDESVRQRLEAWDSIADHPFFAPAFDVEKPLIDAMLEQLDGLCTCEPEPAAFELVGDTTLPLDVEIRTIALDAAVRVIDQAGGSLVEGAAKIERFLRGVEEPAPAPRFYTEQRNGVSGVRDRERPDQFAPFGRDNDDDASFTADALNDRPQERDNWAWEKVTP